MRRLIKVFLTVIVAVNLLAASAFAARPCNMACCMPREAQATAAPACEHCAPQETVGAPFRPCCDMRGGEELKPVTLNTSNAPVFDLSYAAGETPVRFTGASNRFPVRQILGEYESPPIFILNSTFIC